jgi:DamX protein
LSETEEIFLTPESEARLDLIKHLIENSELVPLVRGMPGIGKSLLASRLQATASNNWVVCHFAADSMMQPERLLAYIARCNGLTDFKDENIQLLVDHFEMLRKRGAIPVLLIDDAQELPPTSLITLLRLYERQVAGAPLVSLVLFANEQIDMLLSTPQLQIMSPQAIQVIDLPALTREEADAYMHYLLRIEGLDQHLALPESRMNRLYRETRGAPGPLATAIFDAVGESSGKRERAASLIGQSWLWIVAPLGLGVILLLLFQGPVNRLFSPEIPPAGEQVVDSDLQRPVELPDKMTEIQSEPPEPDASKSAMQSDFESQIEPSVPAIAEQKHPPADQGVPTTSEASMVVAETPSESEEAVSAERPTTAPDSDASAAANDALPSADADIGIIEPPQMQKAPVEEVTAEPPVEVADAPKAEQADVPTAEPVDVPKAKPVDVPKVEQVDTQTAESKLLKSVEWLSKQPPGSYTVQLLAVENIESLQPVIDRYALHDEAFSVRTERQGRTWYPLLWGTFPNRASALNAIKRLAPGLRKGGAWARTISSLRKSQ